VVGLERERGYVSWCVVMRESCYEGVILALMNPFLGKRICGRYCCWVLAKRPVKVCCCVMV
jgi:hypothetical protein